MRTHLNITDRRSRDRGWGRTGLALVAGALAIGLCPARIGADEKPNSFSGEITLTATATNVGDSGHTVKIKILRWSSDGERTPLVAALTPAPVTPQGGAPGAVAGASGAPAAAGDNPATARGGRGAAGRGARGRGGRGGRGDAAALSPMAALTAAIGRAPTLGYLWTNDITGYSIKYAYRHALPDGGERIVLATNRRLGAYTQAWTPTVAPAGSDEEFTVIEMRLDAKGSGEGKTSLTTKVIVDEEGKTVALENYAATPALLRILRRD